jgi:uncharacterized protein YndB with AHSA1/START domain
MTAEKKNVIIQFVFDASVSQVWRAWTDAAMVLKWVGSDPRGKGLEAFADVRPGGQFAFTFQNSDQTRFTAFGRYIDIDQPRHLSFTWEWINEPGVESLVDVSLESENDTTRMVFQHDGLDPASGHDYAYGWKSTFSKLNRVLVAQTILEHFNITLGEWIGFLDDYTLDMLRQPPRAGSWSLGQVYMHITDDSLHFAGQMREAMNKETDGDKEMHEDARSIFRNNGFPDRKIMGPATNTLIPQPESKDQLLQRLLAIRQEVNELFASSEVAGATGKTRHPGLLYFTALEWLQFAEMHLRHHFRQKKRIDEQLFISRQ